VMAALAFITLRRLAGGTTAPLHQRKADGE